METLKKINYFSLWGLGVLTLFILGSEPNSTEESLYEYKHTTDFGHLGWFMCWGWVVCLLLVIIFSTIIYHKTKN